MGRCAVRRARRPSGKIARNLEYGQNLRRFMRNTRGCYGHFSQGRFSPPKLSNESTATDVMCCTRRIQHASANWHRENMEGWGAVAFATTTHLHPEMTRWRPDRIDAQGKKPDRVRAHTMSAIVSKTLLRLAANQPWSFSPRCRFIPI